MSDFLTRRGTTWYFVRRVPAEFEKLDRRGVIRHSTRVKIADDRVGRRAARIAETLNEELERFWRNLANGRSAEQACRFDATRRHARSLGYEYIPNRDLLAYPLEARLDRLEALGLVQKLSLQFRGCGLIV